MAGTLRLSPLALAKARENGEDDKEESIIIP